MLYSPFCTAVCLVPATKQCIWAPYPQCPAFSPPPPPAPQTGTTARPPRPTSSLQLSTCPPLPEATFPPEPAWQPPLLKHWGPLVQPHLLPAPSLDACPTALQLYQREPCVPQTGSVVCRNCWVEKKLIKSMNQAACCSPFCSSEARAGGEGGKRDPPLRALGPSARCSGMTGSVDERERCQPHETGRMVSGTQTGATGT